MTSSRYSSTGTRSTTVQHIRTSVVCYAVCSIPLCEYPKSQGWRPSSNRIIPIPESLCARRHISPGFLVPVDLCAPSRNHASKFRCHCDIFCERSVSSSTSSSLGSGVSSSHCPTITVYQYQYRHTLHVDTTRNQSR